MDGHLGVTTHIARSAPHRDRNIDGCTQDRAKTNDPTVQPIRFDRCFRLIIVIESNKNRLLPIRNTQIDTSIYLKNNFMQYDDLNWINNINTRSM